MDPGKRDAFKREINDSFLCNWEKIILTDGGFGGFGSKMDLV